MYENKDAIKDKKYLSKRSNLVLLNELDRDWL